MVLSHWVFIAIDQLIVVFIDFSVKVY